MAKKEKKEKKGKGFFKEFKEFISRGNVLDMAVGIIIGGAFTAIVTALCNNVLKPIINWILAAIIGADGLDGVYTFLKTTYTTDEAGNQIIDLVNSIYIDWGTLINAIINFLLIALVLFLIIKIINHVRRIGEKALEAAEEANKRKVEAAKEAEAAAGTETPAPAAEETTPAETPEGDAEKKEGRPETRKRLSAKPKVFFA